MYVRTQMEAGLSCGTGRSFAHGRMCWDEHESSITYRGLVHIIDRPHVELRPARFQIKDSLKEMQYGR